MQLSPSSNQYVLFYQGRYYPFNDGQIVIGSDPRCDIPIENNLRVLQAHACLILQEGNVFLRIYDNKAATWVNGTRVTKVQLQDRDEIAVGDPKTKLIIVLKRAPTGQMEFTQSRIPADQMEFPQSGTPAGQMEFPATGVLSHMGGIQVATATPPSSIAATVAQSASPATTPVGPTATTRYLCAAGHIDESFQDYVLRHVVYEDRRAMGESYGVDMQAVVSWCKNGAKRIEVRDILLLALFLLVCVIVLVRVIQLVGNAVNVMNQTNQSYGNSGYNPYTSFGSIFSLPAGLITVLALFVLLIIVYVVEREIKHVWPRTQPGLISLIVLLLLLSAATNILIALPVVLAVPGVIFVELLIRYYGESIKRLSKSEFEKNLMPVSLDTKLVNKLRESFTTQQRNVVVYSGHAPFTGAGYYLSGWSFVVDTTKGVQSDPLQSERSKPQPFTLSQLYGTVKRALEGQGLKDVLEVEEKLYANGTCLLENPPFFDASVLRPLPSVDQKWIEQFREHPTEDVRYYQRIRFNFWRGEVIFTAFLRFVRRGKNLFIEIDYLLLPPLKSEYYWVDNRASVLVASKVWELFKRSFDSPITLWLGVPGRLLRSSSYQRQQRKLAEVARNDPSFDYGAATSVRQVASDDDYHLFFQGLDKEMYHKIVEQELLEAIVQFLDEHHIDTTELLQRQRTILNNGTIVKAENIKNAER